ncbi:MAG: hypothetical protein WD049_04315 [Candidatus Paceibacterota bacterium]
MLQKKQVAIGTALSRIMRIPVTMPEIRFPAAHNQTANWGPFYDPL